MMAPELNELIDRVAKAIAGFNYKPCKREAEFEQQIAARLTKAGISFTTQVTVSPTERFDILIEGGIVLELKIKGSSGDMLRQVERYAQFEQAKVILVVTTRASHRSLANVDTIHGKKIGVLYVGWF